MPGRTQMIESRTAGLRDKPRQRRARERLSAILDAAESLLETTEAEAITTNLIAEKAGVPVSSVYRYFKNVSAVFAFLFDDLNEEIISHIQEALARSQPGSEDWREVTGEIIARLHGFFLENPSYWRLLLVMHLSAELRRAKETMISDIAGFLETRWREGHDGFAGGDPALVARFAVELFVSIETRCAQLDDPEAIRACFDELLKATEAYLALYLNQSGRDGGR